MTLKRLYLLSLKQKKFLSETDYIGENFIWLRSGSGYRQILDKLWLLEKAEDIADQILDDLEKYGYEDAYSKHPITKEALTRMLNRCRKFFSPSFIEWYRLEPDYEKRLFQLYQKYGSLFQTNKKRDERGGSKGSARR